MISNIFLVLILAKIIDRKMHVKRAGSESHDQIATGAI